MAREGVRWRGEPAEDDYGLMTYHGVSTVTNKDKSIRSHWTSHDDVIMMKMLIPGNGG